MKTTYYNITSDKPANGGNSGGTLMVSSMSSGDIVCEKRYTSDIAEGVKELAEEIARIAKCGKEMGTLGSYFISHTTGGIGFPRPGAQHITLLMDME